MSGLTVHLQEQARGALRMWRCVLMHGASDSSVKRYGAAGKTALVRERTRAVFVWPLLRRVPRSRSGYA
ncbi:hypothetical protein [Paenibacillus chitinolyticus]